MSGLTLSNLEYYRMRAGMSQQELADAAGCSLRTVQRIEGNDKHSVNFSTARRLSQALQIELTELVGIGPIAEQPFDENATEGKDSRVIEAFLAADSAAEATLQKYGPWGFQEGIAVASLFAARYCYGMSVQMDDGSEPVDKRELAFEIWDVVKAFTERAIDNNFSPVGGDRETQQAASESASSDEA